MARLFPQFSACRFDTPGERRLAERLQRKLEDDYLVWCNVPVGAKAVYPDFIVLHPSRGLLVLEVKDWRVETVQAMDRTQAQIHVGGGIKKVVNPQLQARQYVLSVNSLLEKDPALKQAANTPYAGRLCMPYGWGAVLTRITRKQFNEAGWGEVLDPQRVICSDEMTESVEPEDFQQRLWDMFTQVFPCQLSLPQIDRVRGHLFPELRVNHKPGQFGLFSPEQDVLPDLMKVMDLQQEQLARSLGEGHRVLHGVAGSGKTMILAYRSLHIAQAVPKPVLILCFNRSLAARLRQIINERGGGGRVVVHHFHGWCGEMLTSYHLPKPAYGVDFDTRNEQMVSTLIKGVEQGRVPRSQYAAILIDEGHDFEPDWFQLVVQMLDPASDSLLVLYDDAQSIYRPGPKRRAFSFSSVGIRAQGRTTILRLNYRNTAQVLAVARAFAQELLNARDADEDGVPQVLPESAGRHGPYPELRQCAHTREEMREMVLALQQAAEEGQSWSEMVVIYRTNYQAKTLEQVLQRAAIPFTSALSTQGRDALFASGDTVKLVSMHSSKGLKFPFVLIPGLGQLPLHNAEPAEEARLLYVAMTRALERLILLSDRPSDFSRRLATAITQARGALGEALAG